MRRTPSVFAALTSRTGMRRVLAAYAVYDFIEFYAWLTVILWASDRGGAGVDCDVRGDVAGAIGHR